MTTIRCRSCAYGMILNDMEKSLVEETSKWYTNQGIDPQTHIGFACPICHTVAQAVQSADDAANDLLKDI